MDLNELVKLAPQLREIAAIIVGGVPLGEIIKRIVLPSADVLGKRMADRVEHCLGKMAKMIVDAGATPKQPEDRIIVEILRGASLEEDEDLHTMWAALLANAGSAENRDSVQPGFAGTLRQLSRDEALLLQWIYDTLDRNNDILHAPLRGAELIHGYASIGYVDVTEWNQDKSPKSYKLDEMKFQRCLDSLQAAQLIRLRYDMRNPLEPVITEAVQPYSLVGIQYYSLTARGFQFVMACRAPKPRQ